MVSGQCSEIARHALHPITHRGHRTTDRQNRKPRTCPLEPAPYNAPMNRIDALFAESRRLGKTAFVPFLTAGDPSLETTPELIGRLSASAERMGVPILFEIGFPYSDPIADGPAIQASYTRVLDRGVKRTEVFRAVAEARKRTNAPMLAMASFSLIYRAGVEAWLDAAKEAGLDGVVPPDLPMEEATELLEKATARDLRMVRLIAPTTPNARAETLAKQATGFIYAVAVTGITGERESLPAELADRVKWLRTISPTPVCVGFGVSRPEHVAALKGVADGVIVGSALVKRLPETATPAGMDRFIAFAESLMKPLQ
jgi:tryptophan synthase alpha chain